MSCQAPGLSQMESGIELTHCSTAASLDEDAPSELDLAEAYEQLESMKQRVLQMKCLIVRHLSTKVKEPTATVQADSDNVQLREIQRETSLAFQQIGQVKNRLKETIRELETLSARILESERCTNKLSKNLDEVPKWMEEHKHQAALCLERHNELDTSCTSYLDYSNYMRPLQMTLKNKFHSKIPERCYEQDYLTISDHLSRTRSLLNQTRDQLMTYTQVMAESLSKYPTRASQLLPDITNLTCLLEHNQQMDTTIKRPSLHSRHRTSFKFAWGTTPTEPTRKSLLTVPIEANFSN